MEWSKYVTRVTWKCPNGEYQTLTVARRKIGKSQRNMTLEINTEPWVITPAMGYYSTYRHY